MIAFSKDDALLFSAGEDRTIRIWSASNGQPLDVLTGHAQNVTALVAAGPDTLASASADGTVRLWRSHPPLSGAVQAPTIVGGLSSYDGQSIMVVDDKGGWTAWNLLTDAPVKHFQPKDPHAYGALSPKLTMAWLMGVHVADVVDATTGATLFRHQTQSDLTLGCFSWDEKWLGLGHLDGRLTLFELPGGASTELRERGPAVVACSFRPDGREILIADSTPNPEIWDVASRSPRLRLQGLSRAPTTVRYSSDGRRIAAGASDATAVVWDAQTGRILSRFDEHRASVYTVAFSPNQLLLATGSRDSTVKIWDISQENGRLLDSFSGLGDTVAVGFSADSKRVFVASRSGFRHWEVSLDARGPREAVEQTEARLPFRLNAQDVLVPAERAESAQFGQ
jgi:hypothetical protein